MENLPTCSAAQFLEALKSPNPPLVLDVRDAAEFAEFPLINGAVHIPLNQLPQRWLELAATSPIAVVCRAGGRSAQATAFLLQHGLHATNVAGGMAAFSKL